MSVGSGSVLAITGNVGASISVVEIVQIVSVDFIA
jgi:hypothetical protein